MTLRSKVLAILSILMVVSLAGVASSFWMTQQVNSRLNEINMRSVPFQRELAQLVSDTELLKRELERSMGYSYWSDPRWKPRRLPKWVLEVHRSTIERFKASYLNQSHWKDWHSRLIRLNDQMGTNSDELFNTLKNGQLDRASELYPHWVKLIDLSQKEVDWAKRQLDQETRVLFQNAQEEVGHLRLALQILLVVVIAVSLLILWMGERALRPIGMLRSIVQEIAKKGELTADHKLNLPEVKMRNQDEVSELAREFSQMATALLEREKTVQWQKEKLADQNELLKSLGLLNQAILKSIPSLLIVVDAQGAITHLNERMAQFLKDHWDSNDSAPSEWIGQSVHAHPLLKDWFSKSFARKIEPTLIHSRMWSGVMVPMLLDSTSGAEGRVLLLDDITDNVSMEKRLQEAEHLAAVGRMSAQVAHEVGNPLHSIGLEAELGLEVLEKISEVGANPVTSKPTIQLEQNFKIILSSVERLKKIIQNYLRLSRLSPGQKTAVSIKDVVENALATHANSIQALGIRVNWKFSHAATVLGDSDLLEYALGNLLRNSIQALEHYPKAKVIEIEVGQELGQVYVLFKDSGPGVPVEIRDHIFKPFYTTKASGTGLGLSFVKKVVEDIGGRFELVDGEPSSFLMVLPSFVEKNSEIVASRSIDPGVNP